MRFRPIMGFVAVLIIGTMLGLTVLRLEQSRRAPPIQIDTTHTVWWPSQAVSQPPLTIAPTRPVSEIGSSSQTTSTISPGLFAPTSTRFEAEATRDSIQLSSTNQASEQAVSALPENPLDCLPEGSVDDPAGDIVTVSWIQDGASLVIDRQGEVQTVRLIGVDPPPSARRELEAILNRTPVRLIADGEDTDAVGRLRRYVITLDGRLVNYEMLLRGAARLDSRLISYSCRETFAIAEQHARTAEIGLWGLRAAAIPPTDTRVPTPTFRQGTSIALLATPTLTSPAGSITPSLTSTLAPGQTAGPPTPTSTHAVSVPTSTVGTPPTTGPTSTQPATATATPPGTATSLGPMVIANIFVLGRKANEPDEYIEIKNTGSTEFALGGWSLYSDSSFAELYFPSDFTLGAGKWCRVYTNEIHPDSCAGLSFGMSTPAWDNEFDCGGLYNQDEESISEFCYELNLGGT